MRAPSRPPGARAVTARGALAAGAALGALAVALGAFGAHALRDALDARALRWYGTAVDYHARHALALLGCGLLARTAGESRASAVAGACLLAGTALFSGSLYAMALTGATWLGAITPLGGALLIAGWAALGVAALRA